MINNRMCLVCFLKICVFFLVLFAVRLKRISGEGVGAASTARARK